MLASQKNSRRHGLACRQRSDLHATTHEYRIGIDHQRLYALLHKARKGRVDLARAAGGNDLDFLAEGGSRRLRLLDDRLGIWIVRVDEHANARGFRQKASAQSLRS